MEENMDPGSAINTPDYFPRETMKQLFGSKMLKFFVAGPGSGAFATLNLWKIRIRDKHPGSATLA
jgi:hypothetical protein